MEENDFQIDSLAALENLVQEVGQVDLFSSLVTYSLPLEKTKITLGTRSRKSLKTLLTLINARGRLNYSWGSRKVEDDSRRKINNLC